MQDQFIISSSLGDHVTENERGEWLVRPTSQDVMSTNILNSFLVSLIFAESGLYFSKLIFFNYLISLNQYINKQSIKYGEKPRNSKYCIIFLLELN